MPKLIHAMVRVFEPARSLAFYTRLFGLVESHRMDFPSFALIYLREPESGFEIELTWNKSQSETYTHGTGYGHLAFCVPDLEGHHHRARTMGFAPGDIKTLTTETSHARFYFITDPDGYKIEVLERSGHYV